MSPGLTLTVIFKRYPEGIVDAIARSGRAEDHRFTIGYCSENLQRWYGIDGIYETGRYNLTLGYVGDRNYSSKFPPLEYFSWKHNGIVISVRMRITDKYCSYFGVDNWNKEITNPVSDSIVEVNARFSFRNIYKFYENVARLFRKCSRINRMDIELRICTNNKHELKLLKEELIIFPAELGIVMQSFSGLEFGGKLCDYIVDLIRARPVKTLRLIAQDYDIPGPEDSFATNIIELVDTVTFECAAALRADESEVMRLDEWGSALARMNQIDWSTAVNPQFEFDRVDEGNNVYRITVNRN